MTTKKKGYTARDYEDIVRIELDDAIAKESKEKKVLKEPCTTKLRKDMMMIMLPTLTHMGGTSVQFTLGNKVIGGHYNGVAKENFGAEVKMNVTKEQFSKIEKVADEFEKAKETYRKQCVTKNALEAKRADYKNLAARFRLGYTGDPADLDGIQNKCRAFLLGGK